MRPKEKGADPYQRITPRCRTVESPTFARRRVLNDCQREKFTLLAVQVQAGATYPRATHRNPWQRRSAAGQVGEYLRAGAVRRPGFS